jgi:hypothetical protein
VAALGLGVPPAWSPEGLACKVRLALKLGEGEALGEDRAAEALGKALALEESEEEALGEGLGRGEGVGEAVVEAEGVAAPALAVLHREGPVEALPSALALGLGVVLALALALEEGQAVAVPW